MKKDDLEFKIWDDYYDRCADIWRKDLNSDDPDKKEFAEYMVKCMEEAKQWDYTAVEDPFTKGHITIIKHKRGEPRRLTWEEEKFNKLSFPDQILVKIRKHLRK